jgi:hypothetical protein
MGSRAACSSGSREELVAVGSNRALAFRRSRQRAGRPALLAAAASGLVWLVLCAQAQAASTYTVNTTADITPSSAECEGAPGDCSLRQALDKAQSGDLVIVPASGTPYEVTEKIIPVNGGVTIEGAGDAATTLDGGDSVQAFELLGGGPVTVKALTITHTRNNTGGDQGGAINGSGEDQLTLEDVTISNSESQSGFGGAIEIAEGEVTIRHSRFVGDSVTGTSEVAGKDLSGGGAIDLGTKNVSRPDSLTISDSVFQGDSAAEGSGGAIQMENGGTLAITSSTFSEDVAYHGEPGGAIALFTGTTATIVNSTFTGNAAGTGGAVWMRGKSLFLLGDTLAGDAAEEGANVDARTGVQATTLENTIVATPLGGGSNCIGMFRSVGHNLEDTESSSCGLGAAGDIIGKSPQLQPLAVNSSVDPTAEGPPETLALAGTSPVVGAGDPGGCAEEGTVDERGFPRPGMPEGQCDIGAYELLPAVATATTLAASTPSSAIGQPVTLTATVQALRSLPAAVPLLAGSVEFRAGGVSLGSAAVGEAGVASLSTTALTAGAQQVTAAYLGNALYAGSTSAPIAEDVVVPAVVPQPTAPSPALSHVRQASSRWREGSRLSSLARRGRRRPPLGTTFAFALSAPATVTLTFTHPVWGRRAHGRCVTQTRRNRHAARCRTTADAGVLRFTTVPAGTRRIGFDGRLSSRRWLSPGSYTVTIAASNQVGRSAPVHLTFTILKG